MIIYKVFTKNYDMKKGELLGMLIERRKDLRGMTPIQAGMRWAGLTFGHLVKDRKSLFIVPTELNLGQNSRWLMEKGIFTREELLSLSKLRQAGIGF
ncbi:MAG: hypothetical protein N3G78_04600 [Desulfobacterota bacterium]|nr:hypothetical protein [Thermodesulfobacteriota bacterium]